MAAAVNAISMTLVQQPGKEKLIIFKTSPHSFHSTNISYRSDLKICLPSPEILFSSPHAWLDNFFFNFEMEKIALILVYNIFVTKNFFFTNELQKNF